MLTDAADIVESIDWIDLSDLRDVAVGGDPCGLWCTRDRGDSGIMRRGRRAKGVGLGADGVGTLRASNPGERIECGLARSSS